ncbi:MAG: hypothetical protein AAF141_06215 [Pseudomonadota bacterium]
MLKKTLIIALATTSFAAFAGHANAAAHAKACDEETMSMVMKSVEMAEGDKKAMAMEEFSMAKEKMEAGMADECSGHLTKAAEITG